MGIEEPLEEEQIDRRCDGVDSASILWSGVCELLHDAHFRVLLGVCKAIGTRNSDAQLLFE